MEPAGREHRAGLCQCLMSAEQLPGNLAGSGRQSEVLSGQFLQEYWEIKAVFTVEEVSLKKIHAGI